MFGEKKISLVIPAHNEERLIVPTLEGVPETIDRVYVIDDASQDSTCEVVQRYAERDPRVVLLRHEVNKGVGAAIITGYLQSSADDFDIAVDPLEGTNFAANNLPGALSVIAITEKNNLFNAPETYMEKISSKVRENGVIDLDFTVKKNISNLSDYLNKNPENLTACILNRPRHQRIIDELKNLKVKTKLITDGDVSGALLVTDQKYDVDIFLGTGGGPEGVLAATALDAFNCGFQGRFLFESNEEKLRAKKMGIDDLTKKYELKEIVSGDSIFCATGITSGDLVSGIIIEGNEFISESLVTHKSSGTKKILNLKKKI